MSGTGKRATILALGVVVGLVAGGQALAQDLRRGAEIYELCSQCHGAQGEGNEVVLAPTIAGLDQWYVARQLRNYKGGLRGLHPEDVGGLRMYPMSLSLKDDASIDAVAAYVASMDPAVPTPVLSGGDATRGAKLYQVCVQCHGEDGAGNEQLKAPKLRGASDWYLLSSLQKYKAGVRGNNPKNTYAQLMRGMSATLKDEQAMKDVIAHIMTLDD